MSISASDIRKSIEKFLENNNLHQALHAFKNQNCNLVEKVRTVSSDRHIKQLICVSKKQAYQLHKLSNQIIDQHNSQTEHQLRQHLQQTDQKVLCKVIQRIKKSSKKHYNQKFEDIRQNKLRQMNFFKNLMKKQRQKYQLTKIQQLGRKGNNPLLQQSRQYQNQWQNPNQNGYDVNQFYDSQFQQVCKQLKAVRSPDYANQLIKQVAYPEEYYSKVMEYKERINLNIYDKFYSRLPADVRFPSYGDQSNHKQVNLNKKPSKQSSDDEKNSQGIYPLQMDDTVYDCYDLKIIYDRDKTGFQEERDIKIVINQVLGGKYQIISNLGQAQFSNAIEVKDLTNQKRYCLKIIKNNKEYLDQSLDQIKMLKYIKGNCNPDQKCLLNLQDYFYHKQHLMILTDLLKDTLLHAYQMNREMFSNLRNLQLITRQILLALQKLHSLHIVHTDLKPENIMIKSYTNRTVKVIDLGSSVFFHQQPTYYIQTRSYRAPEVILGIPYDAKIDIWSLGCIIAEVFTGQLLFQAQTEPALIALIQGLRGPWPSWMIQKGLKVHDYFTKDMFVFEEVKDQAKNKTGKTRIYTPKMTNMKSRIKSQNKNFLDFLLRCLKIDPSQRISASEALYHPFITQTIVQ